MPSILLPASAAAFAPRSTPTVVLNTKVDPWLTATLKRINRVKRPLNSVPQHMRCLTETLSSPSAIWTLCSLMLPKAPDSQLRKDSNPLVEALFNYQLLHIEAYVVHVDLVLQNEIAFKLTPESIAALTEYHKDIYLVDTAAAVWNWSEKETQIKKLQEEFVQAVNKFVYRTSASALEGLEDDGAGELLCGRSEDVKSAIMGLFMPLLPPPQRLNIIRPAPLLPSSPATGQWWQPTLPGPAPVESWRVVPSSPSISTTAADSQSQSQSQSAIWASMAGFDNIQNLPSPTPSYSQPFSQPYSTASNYYSAPQSTAPLALPQLPLPSMIAQQQCSTSAGLTDFRWDRYHEYTPTM